MQGFLSAYANGWSRRLRTCGLVFQSRYRTEVVEDQSCGLNPDDPLDCWDEVRDQDKSIVDDL
jgi:hypothetical protein